MKLRVFFSQIAWACPVSIALVAGFLIKDYRAIGVLLFMVSIVWQAVVTKDPIEE